MKMVKFNRIVALTIIIGVLQMCRANPVIVEEENDVTKLFTVDELQNARNAGIKDGELITGRSSGVTVDEMIKLILLAKNESVKKIDSNITTPFTTFEEMTKVCDILVAQHKTATNYTSDQEIQLNELMESIDQLPRAIKFLYIRKSICAYLSEPFRHEMDATAFGLKFIPYMKLRFWKLKNQNATDVERVDAAKVMCCIYKGHDKISELKVDSTLFSLSNEKMVDFAKYWNEFETANTLKSFEQVCNFLRATNPSEEC